MTLRLLSIKYKKSIPTIRRYFDLLITDPPKRKKKRLLKRSVGNEEKIVNKNINLVFDETFFGRNFGFLIYRGNINIGNVRRNKRKFQNIHYRKIKSEKIAYIEEDLIYLSRELG